MSSFINILEKYYLPNNINDDILQKVLKTQNTNLDISMNSSLIRKKTSPNLSLTDNIEYSYSMNFAKCFRINILPYLSLNDIVNLKLSNKVFKNLINEKAFKLCAIANSIKGFTNIKQKYNIWKYYLEMENYKLSLFEYYKYYDLKNKEKSEEYFYNIIQDIINQVKQDKKVDPNELPEDKKELLIESISNISKDITRTFHNDRFNTNNGLQQLQRVLEGVCAVKDTIGYCQGMNFIAGALIESLDSEIDAFMVFNCLFKKYLLSNLFSYVSFIINI